MVNSRWLLKKILHYFGLIPNYNEKTNEFTSSKLKAGLLSIIFASLVIVSLYFIRAKRAFHHSELKVFSDWIMYMIIISWMLCNNTHSAHKFTQIRYLLIGTKLPVNKFFTLILALNILFFLVLLGCSVYMNYEVGNRELNWNLLPSVLEIYSLQCVTLMYSTKILLITLIYTRWLKINIDLENLLGVVPCKSSIFKIIAEHNLANNAVDLYNDIFGFETLLGKLYEMFNILAVLNYLLGKSGSGDLTVMLFAWTFHVCGVGILHAHLCERISNEGKRTVKLAYNILQRYEHYYDDIIKNKMYLLTQQAANRCPRFTAWGFFDLDHKMIFTFLNLTTTYIIVMVQLKMPEMNK